VPAGVRSSDVQFPQPGGAIGGGERGEVKGGRGLLIGAEIDRNGQGF
jgi:hypothetical protein